VKKLFFLIGILTLLGVNAFAIQDSTLYTVIPSTYSVVTSTVTGSITPKINNSKVRVRALSIIPTATAQTITLYSNATSTSKITFLASWNIPASGTNAIYPICPSLLGDVDNFDCPYMEVLTSTTTNPATVTILYR
jgi:hypothetical protein